ncbi:FHA domain-containing protein [Roseibacterium sp. SDUM158017]|uniref:FHA domain-containing protein n=1 Tax=Roseicyclus salinarum TaxID=3036773 RepID=UPI00241567A3|nr:FHA domain-containing protein [Roseibacterium sp. SDUM158017]MDG4647769.1 FHA domain-containing protein [Roseibacterium sp. SDUM158017]
MKRLRDVAVRMRPMSSGSSAGGGAGGPDDPHGEGSMPARAPFAPASRDLGQDRAGHDADRPHARRPVAGERPSAPVSTPRRQIWDLEDGDDGSVPARPMRDAPARATHDAPHDDAPPRSTAPEAEDMASRARRALAAGERRMAERGISRRHEPAEAQDGGKTRVLGFHAPDVEMDPISAVAHKSAGQVRFPTGWLVVVDGPGRGAYFAVTMSVSSIGRGADQSISLNFGDASISRHNHAAIAYDAEQNRFFLGHGNKSNIVRRNGQPVLATEELDHGDVIRIGKTSLRFVALCGDDFTWGEDMDALMGEDGDAHD